MTPARYPCPLCPWDAPSAWAWAAHQLGVHPEAVADHFDITQAEVAAMRHLATAVLS